MATTTTVHQRLSLPLALSQPHRGNRAPRDAPPPVCRYWKSGHCSRNPCRFLHTDAPPPPGPTVKKRTNSWVNPSCVAKPGGNVNLRPPRPAPAPSSKRRQDDDKPPASSPPKRLCGGNKEPDIFCGVARLLGHAKAVTGVAMPDGSDKLFSGSLDGTVRVWDCATGQCVHVAPMQEGAVGSLVSMGPWVLAGVRGAVRALHSATGKELRLQGPATLVTALLAEDDDDGHLFAGTEDGVIFMWRMNQSGQQCFDEVAVLSAGHATKAVALASLALGKGTLYSGYADSSIKAWDVASRRCIFTLAGHTSTVTALLCWDQFLLSSSDDGTVKVWRAKPDHDELDLEVHYVHDEGERVVAINGTYDPENKPVLVVSRGDGIVRVYDLPSMKQRGQIGCNGEARTISVMSPGVIFTGDASGEVRVVKWA